MIAPRRAIKVSLPIPVSDNFRKKYVNRVNASVSKKNNIV